MNSASHSDERIVLACCARARLTDPKTREICRASIARGVDWKYVLSIAERNAITADPHRSEPAAPAKVPVETLAYREPGRPPVTLYVVRGGGHTVPGPAVGPRVGRTAEHRRSEEHTSELQSH